MPGSISPLDSQSFSFDRRIDKIPHGNESRFEGFLDQKTNSVEQQPNPKPLSVGFSEKGHSFSTSDFFLSHRCVDSDGGPASSESDYFSMQDLLAKSPFDLDRDGAISIDEIESVSKHSTDKALRLFTDFLNEHRINPNPSIELHADPMGAIIVKSQHQEKERIEQLLQSNPVVSDALRSAMADQELLAQHRQYAVFSKCYEAAFSKAGIAGCNQVMQIFSGMRVPDFSFVFGENSMKIKADGESLESWLNKTAQSLALS